jgi:hypothetical protein
MSDQVLAEIRSLRAFVISATAECVRANETAADTALEVAKLRRDLDRVRGQLQTFHVNQHDCETYEWPVGRKGSR